MRWAVACLLVACGRFGFSDRSLPAADAMADAMADAAAGSAVPIIYGQTADGFSASGATSLSAVPANPVAAGDLILVGASYDGPVRAVTVSDSSGTAFTEGTSGVAGVCVSHLFYGIAPAAGVDTITANIPSAGASYFQLQVWTYQGIAPVNPLDDITQSQGTSAAPDGATTRPLAVTTNHDLVFEWAECIMTCVAGTGFTARTSFGGDGAGDRTVTSAGNYPAVMTLSGTSYTLVGATFRGR
jgi:hypothetical protein